MFLGTIQKGTPGCPLCTKHATMHPGRVQGPPLPDFFMKLMPIGGAHMAHTRCRGGAKSWQKSILKPMPKKYCKKYAKVSKNTSKIDAKNDGKSARFRNPRNLVFCKNYNVKMLLFHMIKGARNASRIYQKSMSNPTCEKVCKKLEKGIQNGAPNPSKINKKK